MTIERRPGRSLRRSLPRALPWVMLLGLACAEIEEPVIGPSWQAADLAAPLDRVRCIDLALKAAPTAAAWEAKRRAALAALAEAGSLPNPTLSVSWEDLGLGAASPPVQQTFSLLSALEGILSRPHRRAAAGHDLNEVEAEILTERQEIAAEVLHAYDDLLLARERASLRRELTDLRRDAAHAASRMVEVGLLERAALREAEVEVLAAELEQAKDEAEASRRELALAFAMGFERPVALVLAETGPYRPEGASSDLEGAIADAQSVRPEVQAAEAHYAAERERLELANGPFHWLPEVEAGYRRTGAESTAVASVAAPLPVFDDGRPAVESQYAALLLAAANRRRVLRSVAEEVTRAFGGESSARERRLRAGKVVEGRGLVRAAKSTAFAAGEIDYGALAESRRAEVESRLEWLDARAEEAAAKVDLARAEGRAAPPWSGFDGEDAAGSAASGSVREHRD